MKNKNKSTKRIAKKTIFSIGVFMIFFVLTGILKSNAGTGENAIGWLWSNSDNGSTNSAVGYISMNSANTGAAISYGVNIPSTDGSVTGYAWSQNLGYIDFAPVGPYPAVPNNAVVRNGNSLHGWARFVEIKNAASAGNSGGWQGWIKMSGPNYGVTIDPATGKLNGYAWSDELGAISFKGTSSDGNEYGAQIPLAPTVSLNSDTMTINLDNGALPKSVTLNWNVSGATTCTKSGGAWSGTLTNPTIGSESVVQTNPLVTYNLSCTGPGGTKTASVSVTTGCNKKACAETTCASTFIVTGTSNNSTCVTQSSCTTDANCTSIKSGSWREVNPAL